jgi:uncharacterized protein
MVLVELSAPAGVVSAEAAIEIDGDAQPELNTALLSLLIEENTEGFSRCEARFGNWGNVGQEVDYRYFNRSVLDFGKEMAVRMGSDDSEDEVFRGFISALEGQFAANQPPSIAVLAEDKLHNLRVKRRTRTFEDMSDADIFQQIASDHGLQADIDVQGPTHKVVAQLNQSDLAFIRQRAYLLAAEVWFKGGKLLIQSRSSRTSESDEFSLQLGRGLLDFSVIADSANQHTGVLVSGWDVFAKDTISHEASDSILGSELNGDDSGASIVQAAFGNRIDRIVHEYPLTVAEVQSIAEAAFRQQARRFVVGQGTARGDARLRVGRIVKIHGLGDLFSGDYTITEVRHLFRRGAGGGYTTDFVVERAGIGSV